jgi:N-acylethanolamine-hydrolysing acid amidase
MYLTLVPDFLLDAVSFIGAAIAHINPEYHEELEGMSYSLGIDTHLIFFLQYVYEFSAFCTSAIIKMTDGTIVLDRNLDFAFSATMRNITYIARYTKGKEVLFEAPMFAAMNGVLTGSRPGAWAVSLNQRKPSWRTNPLELVKNFASLFTGYAQISTLIKDTLIKCKTYDCAVE